MKNETQRDTEEDIVLKMWDITEYILNNSTGGSHIANSFDARLDFNEKYYLDMHFEFDFARKDET